MTGFTTVEQMKKATLPVGSVTFTQGYYTPNDGGGAQYLIVAGGTGTDDGGSYIDLAGGQQAELMYSNVIKSAWFGDVTGGNVSTNVQAAVDFASSSGVKHVMLSPGNKTYTAIKIPSAGMWIEGPDTKALNITNASTSTPVFITEDGQTRNLWIKMNSFTITTPDNGTHGIFLRNWEHLDLRDIDITTPPSETSLGNAFFFERLDPSSTAFYMDLERLKADKHDRGILVKGGTGFNCNANWIKDCITNNNVQEGIRAEHCSGLEIRGGSREQNSQNIVFDNCSGSKIVDGYFERPDTDNIEFIDCESCSVTNAILSSSGNVTPVGATGVRVTNSIMTSVKDNFFTGTFTTNDITIDATSEYTQVLDNTKKDRINLYTQFRVEISDAGVGTKTGNYRKTGGGAVFYESVGTVDNLVGQLSTQVGQELSVSNTDAKLYAGTGSPESNVTASRGSLFFRTDGGGGFTFYVKETGDATNTGWVSK